MNTKDIKQEQLKDYIDRVDKGIMDEFKNQIRQVPKIKAEIFKNVLIYFDNIKKEDVDNEFVKSIYSKYTKSVIMQSEEYNEDILLKIYCIILHEKVHALSNVLKKNILDIIKEKLNHKKENLKKKNKHKFILKLIDKILKIDDKYGVMLNLKLGLVGEKSEGLPDLLSEGITQLYSIIIGKRHNLCYDEKIYLREIKIAELLQYIFGDENLKDKFTIEKNDDLFRKKFDKILNKKGAWSNLRITMNAFYDVHSTKNHDKMLSKKQVIKQSFKQLILDICKYYEKIAILKNVNQDYKRKTLMTMLEYNLYKNNSWLLLSNVENVEFITSVRNSIIQEILISSKYKENVYSKNFIVTDKETGAFKVIEAWYDKNTDKIKDIMNFKVALVDANNKINKSYKKYKVTGININIIKDKINYKVYKSNTKKRINISKAVSLEKNPFDYKEDFNNKVKYFSENSSISIKSEIKKNEKNYLEKLIMQKFKQSNKEKML